MRQITEEDTGKHWNHNSGLVRNEYGWLRRGGHQPYCRDSVVDVYFAVVDASVPPPWDLYFTNRLWRATAELRGGPER